MFANPIRKLKNLEKSVAKYINKYDAMSLSLVDLTESTQNSPVQPKMESLKVLTTEINDVLNEGYIEQQSVLSALKCDVDMCGKSSNFINRESLIQLGNDLLPDQVNYVNNSLINKDAEIEISAVEKQLKLKLNSSYASATSIMELKSEVLRILFSISENYTHHIVEIGRDNGVLQVATKANVVVAPYFTSLTSHHFLSTSDEQELLSIIRGIWAHTMLRNKDHAQLAEQELASEYHKQKINNNSTQHSWMQHIKIGCSISLLLWAISECLSNERVDTEVWNDQTFSIFLSFGDMLLLLLMWGVSMQVWRRAGIDYVKILQLEHVEEISSKRCTTSTSTTTNSSITATATVSDYFASEYPEDAVYRSSSNLCIIYLIAFIIFNKAVRGGYVSRSGSSSSGSSNDNLTLAHAIPTTLVLFCILRILHPFETRKHWLYMLWRVLAAPCYAVSFRDGYIGDLLTSLARVLVPMTFSFIYVMLSVYAWLSNNLALTASRSSNWMTDSTFYRLFLVPFLTLLPLWLRLMQCLRRSVESGSRWPHMGNAIKYTSAIVVIAYGTYQPTLRHESQVWIISFVFTTLLQFTWDITMDWGLISFTDSNSNSASMDHLTTAAAATAITYSSVPIIGRLLYSSHNHQQKLPTIRSTRLLGSINIYLLVIGFNFILRFAWMLTLLPIPQQQQQQQLHHHHLQQPYGTADQSELLPSSMYVSLLHHLSPILAATEIIRRMVWGFLRLEWEQIEVLSKREQLEVEAKVNEDPESLTSMSKRELNDFETFNKMGIATSIERDHQEPQCCYTNSGNRYTTGTTVISSSSSSMIHWIEADWTTILFSPRYSVAMVDYIRILCRLQTHLSTLRLIDSVLFVSAVMMALLHAALPAFEVAATM